jgi:hypothetical protein
MINFLKALNNVNDNTPVLIEYKLYYNKTTGAVLFYSTEELDEDFIIITQDEYNIGRYDLTIKNNTITYPTEYIYQKIVPSVEGIACDKNDVSIVSTTGTKWSLKQYE